MADESNGNGNTDGVESPQVGICNPCANKWGYVAPQENGVNIKANMKRTSVDLPERIECLDTSGRLLAEAKGTRLSKFTTGASVGSWRKRLLDEVGLQTIIRDIST